MPCGFSLKYSLIDFSQSCFSLPPDMGLIINNNLTGSGLCMFIVCILIMQTGTPTKSLKAKLMNWLGLTNEVTIKVYHGYGHADQLMIHGHVFRLSPLPRKKYRKSFLRNTWALLRLFI